MTFINLYPEVQWLQLDWYLRYYYANSLVQLCSAVLDDASFSQLPEPSIQNVLVLV